MANLDDMFEENKEVVDSSGIDEEFNKGAGTASSQGMGLTREEQKEHDAMNLAQANARKMEEEASRDAQAKYDSQKNAMDAAGDRVVAKGMATKNADGSLSYFDEQADGSDPVSAVKNKSGNDANVIKPGELEVKDGYSRSAVINGLRAEQDDEKKSYVARHTPTESTKTEDGLNRSVFGRMVRYTDSKGNVVKWGEIDENGNEVASAGPSSAAKQADMDKRAEAVKNGASISSAMSDDSKAFMDAARWNSVVAAQRKASSDKIKGDYKQAADEIEKIKQARLAQKRDQRIAASYALGAAASGLSAPLTRDDNGKINDPRFETVKDSQGNEHHYITSYLGSDALAGANGRRRAAGDRNEYDSILARVEVDQNGGRIPGKEVEFGVKDRVGGKPGSETRMRVLKAEMVAKLLDKDLESTGMSKDDAQHNIVNNVLGGISNPHGWKTNQETVLQNAQMQKNFDQGNNLSTNLGNKESVALDANANKNNDGQGRMRAISSVISSALRAGGVAMTPDQMAAVTSKVMGLFGYGNNSSTGSNGEVGKTGVDEMLDKIKQRKQGGGSGTGTVTTKKTVAKEDGSGSSDSPKTEVTKPDEEVKNPDSVVNKSPNVVKESRAELRAKREAKLDRDAKLRSRHDEWVSAGGSGKLFGRGRVLSGEMEEFLSDEDRKEYEKGLRHYDDKTMGILDRTLDSKNAYESARSEEENSFREKYRSDNPYNWNEEIDDAVKDHMKQWDKTHSKRGFVKKS